MKSVLELVKIIYMINKKLDPQSMFEKLQSAQNAIGQSHFAIDRQEDIKVQVRPNKDVSPAMFKPDPLIPGGYIAHPTTIRAMRKDIFAAGDGLFEDLEFIYSCTNCNHKLDLQFWMFCPYCEAQFPKELRYEDN